MWRQLRGQTGRFCTGRSHGQSVETSRWTRKPPFLTSHRLSPVLSLHLLSARRIRRSGTKKLRKSLSPSLHIHRPALLRIESFSFNKKLIKNIFLSLRGSPEPLQTNSRRFSERDVAERDRAYHRLSVLGKKKIYKEREKMAISRVSFGVVATFALIFAIVLPSVQAQSLAPAPAPVSDGTAIDQGIAYLLMLVALVLTYLIHTLDAPFFNF